MSMFVKLESLKARGLVDTGSPTDAQDPSVIVRVGSEEHETSRIKHAGTEADFIETFDLEIDKKSFNEGTVELEVEVVNRGYNGKLNTHVGKGKVALKSVLPVKDTPTIIPIELTHFNKSGDIQKGTVFVSATLSDTSTSSNSPGSSDVQKMEDVTRDEVLMSLFGDVGELLDDFHCAYVGRFLFHGRLYVTTRHVCFYSKIFGKETKMRIPFHHVTSVFKSIDPLLKLKTLVVDAGAKMYKFHSFWDFDVSFRSVTQALASYRGGGQEDSRDRTNSSTTDVIVEEGASVKPAVQSAEQAELMKTEADKSRGKIVVVQQQPLPVSLTSFSKMFVEDGAQFSFKAYHESVRDTSVVATPWQLVGASSEMGREIKFFKPVNLPGLASTRGVKLQSCKRFGEHGLLLSSSTRLEDVPAADCFSVDDTLEVLAKGDSEVLVTISFQVTFVKSTMMKAFIEGPTNSEMKKWMAAFFEHLKKKCVDPKPDTPAKVAETSVAVAAPAIPPALTEPALVQLVPLAEGRAVAIIAVLALLLLLAFVRVRYLRGQVDALNQSLARMEGLLREALPGPRLEEVLTRLAARA